MHDRPASSRHLSAKSPQRPVREWLLLLLLPFVVGWKWLLFHHVTMRDVSRSTALGAVGPYAEAAFFWCLLYAALIRLTRSKRASVAALTIFVCNLVALLEVCDI